MSYGMSRFDERDDTLDAIEESLIAVNLPGRDRMYFTGKNDADLLLTHDDLEVLRDPLFEPDERVIYW